MTSKRGQLTLFIILAIIIIAVGLVVFFIFRPQTNAPNTQEQVSGVKTYLSELIESQVHQNILTVAHQGGYSYAPINSFETPYADISFWVVGNQTSYPSLEEITYQIDLLNFMMGLNNLSLTFPGYEISQGTLETNTRINDDSVQVSVKWPVTIRKNEVTQTIEDYNFNYNIRLKKLYNAATYTANLVAKDILPTQMPLDMNLTVYVYDNASLYEIQDTNKNYQLNEQPYNFVFAVM